MSRIITNSELASYQRCRRQWWLGSVRKFKKRDYVAKPLAVGGLFHIGLEAYYKPGEESIHPLKAIEEKATKMLEKSPDFEKDILDSAELAAIMVEGYMEWVEEEAADADLEVISAEEKVEVIIGAGEFILRGKIDARVRKKWDDVQVQLEHKTVGSLLDIPKTAQQNQQFLTYDLLALLKSQEAEDESYRTDGLIINMARKVKRTKTAKPPFYGRHEVRHNKEELRNHYRHVLAVAREMVVAEKRLEEGQDHHTVVPPRPTRDCSWDCEFYEVCPLFDDGSDAEGMLNALFDTWDPLERYEEEADA